MVSISKRDLAILATAFGIADFFSGGKLQAPIGNAARKALIKAAPAIARGIVRYRPTAVSTAARVTPTGAVVATGGVLAIQNREKIADLAAQGFEVLAPAVQGIGQRALDPQSFAPMGEPRDLLPFGQGPIKRPTRKRLSKFNQSIKAGMAAAKASASYGKKGTINNAKKAFTAVTKTASRINKGGKVAKKGVARKIGLAIKKVLR